MIFSDTPNPWIASLFTLALVGLWWKADAWGLPGVFVVPLLVILGTVAAGLYGRWVAYEIITAKIHSASIKSQTWAKLYDLIMTVATMPAERLAFLGYLVEAQEGEGLQKSQAVSDLNGVLNDIQAEAAKVAESQDNERSRQWYAVAAVDSAVKNHGWLPAIHNTKTRQERKALEEFYAQLEKAGIIKSAVSNQPSKLYGDKAEQARKIAEELR